MNLLGDNRGIALLITLTVTTVLVAVALEYNRRSRFAVISTAAGRNRAALAEMAAGGVHAAMALLVKDKAESAVDTLQEDWANPEKLAALLEEVPFEDGKLTVVITDEMGKLQVNALVDYPDGRQFNPLQLALWERLLTALAGEQVAGGELEPEAVTNAVKDWLDRGDDDAITGLSGAESSYYAELDPPYACRNGPIVDLRELRLIKGITPQLFEGEGETPGLARLLTPWGAVPAEGTGFRFPGRINLNTAELPLLLALLPPEHADLARTFHEIRQEAAAGNESYDFSDPAWYKNIPGFADVRLDERLVTTASDVFRIEATAGDGSLQVTVSAVVERVKNAETGQWSCRVLAWETG